MAIAQKVIPSLTDPESIAILEDPWRNVYWFARMLINSDKYAGVGSNSSLMHSILLSLRAILEDGALANDEKVILCKETLANTLRERYSRAKAKVARIELLIADIENKLLSLDDIHVFVLTAKNVMIPINGALQAIPSDDKDFTLPAAKAYLDKLGDKGLARVINLWDDLGVAGCLAAERVEVIREFTHLRRDLEDFSEKESAMILTAFMQEFERRLGQKRKGRAGGSLEDVTGFILGHFNIKTTNAPDHFQADIEVDKWVRMKNQWLIGISCKRTLRERWKQVSAASPEILSKFKIEQVWHVITYDEDLSDDKLTLLGSQRHIFYLRDDSRKLAAASSHIGMKNFVRPISEFINDLKART